MYMNFRFLLTIILPLLLAASLTAVAQSDVIHVVTHNRVTIVTNPKTGENGYPRWGVFPSGDLSVRRIILHLTLGSPDSMKTAHWDYCDQVILRRQGGKAGQQHDLEIARMLTPYGSIFGKGWNFTWSVDVTDFAFLLRDSTEIEYRHSGYEPDTVGWALTLDFAISQGPPVVKPLGMDKLWQGNFRYGDPAQTFEAQVKPISFTPAEGSGISRLRIFHTGHGMDEPRGCSEFCPRKRTITLDGRTVDERLMWKDCGDNPLYPQGGTWIYDRAAWCPGDLVNPDIIDMAAATGQHTLGLTMDPYTATANIQAAENIFACLFHLSAPLAANDVSVEEIIVPSERSNHRRENPACQSPEIRVKNLGMESLTSLTVRYGTVGFKESIHVWNGRLEFGRETVISLPGTIDALPGRNSFTVSVEMPNGKTDNWTGDNRHSSSFIAPINLPCRMVMRYKSNLHPGDNTISLTNSSGDTVFIKAGNRMRPDTVYNDTLRLPEGCYRLALSDTAGEGLEFWAEPGQGNGYLRLLDTEGRLLHAFTSDCGNGETLSFNATEKFERDTTKTLSAFSLAPREVKDVTVLEVVAGRPSQLTVQITVDGRVTERHEYASVLAGTYTYYLEYIEKGRIVLEALLDGKSCFKGRLFRQKR